ncbi:MAG: DNA-3-methyladenine glycosylase I [Deltaproteobacteria bacterium HGW-Deltaproteobacteria-8]|jgi:DNA-3-methyladenine glycosylase I|nr:MAG: DNA-3-methyladenine glycosylase I [Deltaproteobacteria bacterium HGW-Deltaproteobacteria-8]
MPDLNAPALRPRCPWCGQDPIYVRYHDQEWGSPLHDDRALFELLVLEGAQAGLNWLLVLKKREGYRRAFAGLEPETVARLTEADAERLRLDAGIVRNRQKIASAINNARAFLAVAEAFGSFDAYLWRFVDGAPLQNAWTELRQVPARTAISDALSKDLQARGFKFVGSTIMYAFMQSAGLVNDHLTGCFRHRELGGG